MASTFIPFKNPTISSSWRNREALGGSQVPQEVFLQWVPARVLHTFPVRGIAGNMEGRATNCVCAQPYVGRDLTAPTPQAYDNPEHMYFPLLRGQYDLPLIGDTVLTTTINNQQFYMGPINVNNNPNNTFDEKGPLMDMKIRNWQSTQPQTNAPGPQFSNHLDIESIYNGIKENMSDEELEAYQSRREQELRGMNATFRYWDTDPMGKVPSPLEFSPGFDYENDPFAHYYFSYNPDMIMEGRHGNLIRIGSHFENPYIYITNGVLPESGKECANDGSLITMTERGTLEQHLGGSHVWNPEAIGNDEGNQGSFLPFTLGSDLKWDNRKQGPRGLNSQLLDIENPEKSYFDPLFAGNQILVSSDKVIFNAKTQHAVISAFEDVVIGSGRNIRIHSEKRTIIDASEVCIGQPIDITTGDEIQLEPMVLGESLRKLLYDIVSALQNISVAGIPQVMYSGGLNPSSKSDFDSLLLRLQEPKAGEDSELLIPQAEWLSKYHKIEPNIANKDFKDTIESLKQEQEEQQQTE